MNNVTFIEYWNSFFCWAGDYKEAKSKIKTDARKGYKEYCEHIEQEPIFDQ
jgi:hypothetical protein